MVSVLSLFLVCDALLLCSHAHKKRWRPRSVIHHHHHHFVNPASVTEPGFQPQSTSQPRFMSIPMFGTTTPSGTLTQAGIVPDLRLAQQRQARIPQMAGPFAYPSFDGPRQTFSTNFPPRQDQLPVEGDMHALKMEILKNFVLQEMAFIINKMFLPLTEDQKQVYMEQLKNIFLYVHRYLAHRIVSPEHKIVVAVVPEETFMEWAHIEPDVLNQIPSAQRGQVGTVRVYLPLSTSSIVSTQPGFLSIPLSSFQRLDRDTSQKKPAPQSTVDISVVPQENLAHVPIISLLSMQQRYDHRRSKFGGLF